MTKRKRASSNQNPNDVCGFSTLAGTFFILFLLCLCLLCSTRNQLAQYLLGPTTIHPNTTTSKVVVDPPDETFYDDPQLSYSIEKPLEQWDEKRSEWLRLHPTFAAGARDRILLVTGSQPSPCKNRIGDHLLLRCFKNKVDYCRIHGCEVYYNNLHLQPKMDSYWAKLPVIRSTMMAHPEIEWIWWMDSDAVFTDMEFTVPLERYKDHNLVVHGWANMVYSDNENKSWTGLNTGAMLIRNCQWSMELLDVWSKMGPSSPDYEKWGRVLKSMFKDIVFPLPNDQSSLIYLLYKERRKWGDKTYLEEDYYLESYWIGMLGRFEAVNDGYEKIEEEVRGLGRRHAEKVSLWYSELREGYLKKIGWVPLSKGRRPFVTHFTGCQPCNGEHNPDYDGNTCWKEMERALNFADNQVLRNYGFMRKDLLSSSVFQVPFDFPRYDGHLLS
ncbi:glycosyltransferase 6-like [Abrus precatorius]|uniref:Glycosyltransferase 6-like n=1 Tax=Abrus precatorius TaxID=3816 RepID=A0A8B8KV44_ABRPR|nr:glycosyltransferase 6-like [Abrus precatorius]